jgi:hypothetical protein
MFVFESSMTAASVAVVVLGFSSRSSQWSVVESTSALKTKREGPFPN